VGDGTYRGVTVFDAWENGVGRVDIVEIAATGQVAGTVIHELGHVLAGRGAVVRHPTADTRSDPLGERRYRARCAWLDPDRHVPPATPTVHRSTVGGGSPADVEWG
jgi:hypothetical protein